MSEKTMALIAFIVFYLAVFWSCYYFGRWLRCRIEFRRKFRPVRMALKRQMDALTRLERSVRRLEEAANGMTAECARLKDCGVHIHEGNTDPSKCGCITAQAERCEVCGEVLLKDGNGELRCFKCNPPFAVGDAVRFKCDGTKATITKIGDGYIEVRDGNGNISACHECDIKMSYDYVNILDGNPNCDGRKSGEDD